MSERYRQFPPHYRDKLIDDLRLLMDDMASTCHTPDCRNYMTPTICPASCTCDCVQRQYLSKPRKGIRRLNWETAMIWDIKNRIFSMIQNVSGTYRPKASIKQLHKEITDILKTLSNFQCVTAYHQRSSMSLHCALVFIYNALCHVRNIYFYKVSYLKDNEAHNIFTELRGLIRKYCNLRKRKGVKTVEKILNRYYDR